MKYFVCRVDIFPCDDSEIVSVCPYPDKRNHPSFVNISPTVVIDKSMEMSSRVLQHRNPKNWFSLKKSLNWILTCILACAEVLKYPSDRQYQSYRSNGKVITSTATWKPKNLNFFSKSSKLNLTCILTVFDSTRHLSLM